MTGLQTEFSFTLPKGYVDKHGTLHREGTMRLATARDEIEPLRDPRVAGADDPFLTVIVLSRVLTELGSISQVTPNVIEELFAADLAFLQDFYGIVNFGDPADLELLRQTVANVEPGFVEHSTTESELSAGTWSNDGEIINANEMAESETVRLDNQSSEPAQSISNQTPRGRRAVIEEVKAPAPA